MRRRRIRIVDVYVAIVAVSGVGALALVALHNGVGITKSNELECLLLTAFVAVTELPPIKVPRVDEVAEITPSAAFAFALLLVAGPFAAPWR